MVVIQISIENLNKVGWGRPKQDVIDCKFNVDRNLRKLIWGAPEQNMIDFHMNVIRKPMEICSGQPTAESG